MKKILYLTLLFLFCSCNHFQTKQQIAQKLIKTYLDSVLNDPHSYESVSFTKLDTGKTMFSQTAEYDTINTHQSKISSDLLIERVNANYPTLYDLKSEINKINKLMDDSIKLVRYSDSLEKAFKQVQSCWFISHTYRAKNGFGALGLHTTVFKIDTNVTKILDEQEVKN